MGDFLRNKKVFVPVFIKPARLIPLKDKNTRFSILSISFTSILIILVFFLSATSSFTTKFSKVVFPANVHSASKKTLSSSLEKNSKDKTSITLNTLSPKSLPQLEDYYQWVWNVKTTPYRSLNKENERNDMVEFPIYNEENGFISESKKIMVYNQSFKDSVFEEIDSLPFNAIEKVMKSEGQDFIAAYKASQNVSTSLFSIILMIICIFLLLFIYIFIMIERPKKRIHA